MKVYIYKNELCDPARDIGIAKQFSGAKEVDEFINFFVASMNPKFIKNWRIFITNDEVEFAEVDHHVLMDEPYKLGLNRGRIQEVDVLQRMREVNKRVDELVTRREKAREMLKKQHEQQQQKEQEKAPE